MKQNYRKLLSIAIKASVLAGIEILKVYDSDFDVEYKSDSSPLTQADKNANRVIIDFLLETGIPILSEEGKSTPFVERKSWESLWIVDPLDGTKEFVKRNGEFTVNIALVEHGAPTLGVIFSPVLGLLYFADPQKQESFRVDLKPSWLTDSIDNEWLFQNSQQLPLKNQNAKLVVAASRSHLNDETKAFIARLEEIHGAVDFVSKGSSLKLCMVAESTAQVYPRFAPTYEWDTAAGHAIVNYAGASVLKTDFSTPLHYNKADLLNPHFIVIRNDLLNTFR
jgi:3'(2'), 5'-bisphosphate nucleotidase